MRLTSRERVEGAIHLLGDGEVLRADVQGPCTLDLRLGGEIPRWRSTVERSCSKLCSNGADFADVRERSPVSRSLVALRIRSLANGGEHAAQDWGSRGRRFKSCHPDGKQQVRGRFGQNPRRPLCCRVAIGVATAHVLTSPLLLRAAGRRSAPSVETAARRYAVAPPPRACALQIKCHSVCRPTPFIPKALAAFDRPQCLLGLTALPLPVVKTRPVSTKIEAALSRSTAWLALTHPRAPQSRGRGASYGVSARFWAH